MAGYDPRARRIMCHSRSLRLRPGISTTTTVNVPTRSRSSRLPPGRSPRSSSPSTRISDHLDEERGDQEQPDVAGERDGERAGVRELPAQQAEEQDPADGHAE